VGLGQLYREQVAYAGDALAGKEKGRLISGAWVLPGSNLVDDHVDAVLARRDLRLDLHWKLLRYSGLSWGPTPALIFVLVFIVGFPFSGVSDAAVPVDTGLHVRPDLHRVTLREPCRWACRL
jgi:hypothetical protein